MRLPHLSLATAFHADSMSEEGMELRKHSIPLPEASISERVQCAHDDFNRSTVMHSLWLAGRKDSPTLERGARARAASACRPTLGARQRSHRRWTPLPRLWVCDAAPAACAPALYMRACPAPLMPCSQPDKTRQYFDPMGANLILQIGHLATSGSHR